MTDIRGDILAVVILASALGGCSSINTWLASALADQVPSWAGGVPPGAPPRPGTIEYEDYAKKIEGTSARSIPDRGQPTQSPENSSKADY